ncbi:class I SAM-dependent methyltransferase [Candidatus Omnitrophota bacterium]
MAYKRIEGFKNEGRALNCMDKAAMNDLFKKCDEQGIYSSCQPIYGFHKVSRPAGDIQWYIITFHILKMLARLEFDSLLDVGAAEGFTAHLAKELFGVRVATCDFCEEGCKRAKEIFGMNSIAADSCELPFKDNEFDVVLCSESLEHVVNLPKAVDELIRVAKKAVVITVPHESPELIEMNITGEGKGSSHIHSFDVESFSHLDYTVIATRFFSPLWLLKVLTVPIEAAPRKYHEKMKYPRVLVDVYNNCLLLFKKVFGKKAAALLIRLDEFVSSFTTSYNAISVVILKDTEIRKKPDVKVSPHWILNASMPYHYLRKKQGCSEGAAEI